MGLVGPFCSYLNGRTDCFMTGNWRWLDQHPHPSPRWSSLSIKRSDIIHLFNLHSITRLLTYRICLTTIACYSLHVTIYLVPIVCHPSLLDLRQGIYLAGCAKDAYTNAHTPLQVSYLRKGIFKNLASSRTHQNPYRWVSLSGLIR